MKKNILVIGGAGYIGSQTVLALLEKNYNVIVFDNLCAGHQEVLPESVKFWLGDITKIDDLEKVFENNQIDGVVHFAANPATNDDISENIHKYYRNNFIGTLNVAEALVKYGVKNVVFSSTAAVYGSPEALPIKETQSLLPLNLYGQTKLMAEKMLFDFSRMYGTNTICLRYFNACGADKNGRTGENHHPETHLIPIILEVAQGKREFITIFGNDYDTKDGTCVRDYIHTMDLATAHVLALEKMFESEVRVAESINVATGNGYTNLEIIKTVEKVTGKKILLKYGNRRPGDWDSAYADNTKAREYLGWEPKHSDLENIIQTAWNWAVKVG